MISSSSLAEWLIEASAQGTLAILLVAAIAPLLRRWLGAQASYWLWALVLFRLLVPGLPASPIHWPTPSFPRASASWFATAHVVENLEKTPPGLAIASPGAPVADAAFPWPSVAISTWLIGLALILGFAIARSLRASGLARRAHDISDDPQLSALLGELSLASSRFRIRETRELRSPALCGLLRPIILLPLDWRQRLDPTELRCVLLHEIGHFQRGDLLWRWAFFSVCALHWFNPLVWMASRLARHHQEMACDEWVISRASAPSPILYGETLLTISVRHGAPGFTFPVQAEMAESKTRLRRRIAHLASVRPHGWPARVATLLAALALVVITGPLRSEPPDRPVVQSTPPARSLPSSKSAPKSGSSPFQVQIESKFVQITSQAAAKLFGEAGAKNDSMGVRAIYSVDQFQDLMRRLGKIKGVDLMSAPTVTTKSGNKAIINVIREFRYPSQFDPPQIPQAVIPQANGAAMNSIITPTTPSAFETRNLGVTLEVTPTASAGGHTIDLELAPEMVDFDGFINYGSPILTPSSDLDRGGNSRLVEVSPNVINQPVFSVRRMRTFLSVRDRQTVLIGVMNINDHSITGNSAPADAKLPPAHGSDQSLFVFVTATLIDAEGKPIFGHGSVSTSPHPSRTLVEPIQVAYGTPVKGALGFVTSPYAHQASLVDVRGFPSGTKVRDPYTDKIFLVP